jgi:DNA-binding HxlR family transcriptional regulator
MGSGPWLRQPLKSKKLEGTTPPAPATQLVIICNQLYNHHWGRQRQPEWSRVRKDHRSECVINLTVEIFGDQWSLLVIRDIIFMNRRHFRELLTKSVEGIASNILADRLQRLVQQGIIVKSQDASHKQKAIYGLTERGIELLPVLMEMVAWGHKCLPASRLRGMAQVLEEGGPKLRAEFMSELRKTHLPKSGAKKKVRSRAKSTRISAMQKLQAAYETELARR